MSRDILLENGAIVNYVVTLLLDWYDIIQKGCARWIECKFHSVSSWFVRFCPDLVLGGIYEWNIVLVLFCRICHRDSVRRMVRSWIVSFFQLRNGQCGGSHKGAGDEDPKFAACVLWLLLLSCWFLRCTVFCSYRRLRDKWCLCMNSSLHFDHECFWQLLKVNTLSVSSIAVQVKHVLVVQQWTYQSSRVWSTTPSYVLLHHSVNTLRT